MGQSHRTTSRAPGGRLGLRALCFAAAGGAAVLAWHGLRGLDAPAPAALGAESLRLLGSGVLLLGVLSLVLLAGTYAPGSRAVRTTRIAAWVQGFHVLEHLALVLTFFCTGRFAGVSTLFGLVEPSQVSWTYRIWWHAGLDLAMTALLLRAGWQLRAERTSLPAVRLGSFVPVLKQVRVSAVVATAVRLASGLATVVLVGDVVFVVFGANQDNELVAGFGRLADGLVLFFEDLFVLSDPKVNVAVNYGLAAAAYFLVGRVVAILRGRAEGPRR